MVRKDWIIVAAAIAIVVAGCGKKEKSGFTIGYSQSTLQDPWRRAMNAELETELKNHPNVTLNRQDAQNSASTQINQVENLDTQGMDALLISPFESASLTPEVGKIFKKNIPVILLDRGIDSDQYTTLVGADNILIGEQAGKYVASRFPKGAKIIEIAGIMGATATKERAEGFRKGIGDPAKWNIVSQPGNYLRSKAIEVFQNMLTANPEVQVVYAHNDEMALGAVGVLKRAGKLKEVAVIGVDGQNEAIQSVADGDMAATYIYPRPGADGLKAALDVLSGKKVEKRIVLPTTQITKANAKDFVGKGFQRFDSINGTGGIGAIGGSISSANWIPVSSATDPNMQFYNTRLMAHKPELVLHVGDLMTNGTDSMANCTN